MLFTTVIAALAASAAAAPAALVARGSGTTNCYSQSGLAAPGSQLQQTLKDELKTIFATATIQGRHSVTRMEQYVSKTNSQIGWGFVCNYNNGDTSINAGLIELAYVNVLGQCGNTGGWYNDAGPGGSGLSIGLYAIPNSGEFPSGMVCPDLPNDPNH